MKYHLLLALVLLLFIAGAEASTITHKGRPSDSTVQEYVDYAREISNWDIDFIATLEAENGRRDPKRQSLVPDNKRGMSANGREDSRGFCQLHRRRHKNIVDDPRFFSDPKRQLDQCRTKYKWWTKFYWYNVRKPLKSRFAIGQAYSGSVIKDTETVPTPLHHEWCKYIGTVWEGRKLQVDLHWVKWFISVLFDYVFWEGKKGIVFNCDS